jgi:hypothetical protein
MKSLAKQTKDFFLASLCALAGSREGVDFLPTLKAIPQSKRQSR